MSGPNDLKKGPKDDVPDPVACVFAYPNRYCWADVVKIVLLLPIVRS